MKKYVQLFFTVWAVVLIANQVFIFHACFAPHCIVAALPHTGIISFILTRFIFKQEKVEKKGKSQQKEDNQKNRTISSPTFETGREVDVDPLKEKGDQYEKFIGLNFEKKGDIVIYNGFIQGYEDEGVDIIAVSQSIKSMNLIQCKNWTNKSMELSHIKSIYEKLEKFDCGCCIKKIGAATILKHLQLNGVDKDLLIKQLCEVRKNYGDYIVRKTLYISSEKVVNLEVGEYLTLIKKNIFRYKDMKIVLVEI